MKICALSRWIIVFFLLGGSLGPLKAQSPDVGAQVDTLWSANNLIALSTYLQGLVTSSPNYAPAIVAEAFYDYIFLGKLSDAKAQLLRISTAAQNAPQTYSQDFVTSLNTAISQIDDEIRIQKSHGQSEQDLQANADPQAIRNALGTNAFPLIELIKDTPKITVPSQ